MMMSQDRQLRVMEAMIQQQHISTMSLSMPKPDMPTFSGDPVDYCAFTRAFDSLIASKSNDNSTRLYLLMNYTR